jgi:hypothetical protein
MTYVINQPQEKWVQYTIDGVTYDISPRLLKNELTMLTEEQALLRATDLKQWNDESADRKLKQIKEERLTRLEQTDWYSNSDVTMPDNIATWRQSLRDIPQNNTTEEQYDLLLARDINGNFTNAIWSKP